MPGNVCCGPLRGRQPALRRPSRRARSSTARSDLPGFLRRVPARRRLDHAGQHRALGDRELRDVLVEVRLRRRLDAVGAAAEVDRVEVVLEDLVLALLLGDLDREHDLLVLAPQRVLVLPGRDLTYCWVIVEPPPMPPVAWLYTARRCRRGRSRGWSRRSGPRPRAPPAARAAGTWSSVTLIRLTLLRARAWPARSPSAKVNVATWVMAASSARRHREDHPADDEGQHRAEHEQRRAATTMRRTQPCAPARASRASGAAPAGRLGRPRRAGGSGGAVPAAAGRRRVGRAGASPVAAPVPPRHRAGPAAASGRLGRVARRRPADRAVASAEPGTAAGGPGGGAPAAAPGAAPGRGRRAGPRAGHGRDRGNRAAVGDGRPVRRGPGGPRAGHVTDVLRGAVGRGEPGRGHSAAVRRRVARAAAGAWLSGVGRRVTHDV